ncbi:MAG: glucose-6-phosphate dehydrogenase [Candidatus Dormibacteraeota bacterium]|uniref:Glucose-6-phosphate 1-dehydrogenase n=1 Tax=Candidatus Aeolococcus gillhamiae TaxID=3127015 RepID=A0A2W6ACN8_9BACT|nr:glucose-6-phosphate dehydrogenase [Candidatus Dormibacteraeota bacterium]PZR83068.1 MAG: glucose-6-phosphate dehydrogenase [Candidatus Dormibacter sp. RRmetagenome_bin12]
MTETEVKGAVTLEAPAQSNPLSEGLRQGRVPLPCVVVIFGATGDLTKRKLMPALYALAADGQLPPGFSILGAGRTEQSTDEFRELMRESVKKYGRVALRDDVWSVFADGLRYCSFDLDADDGLKAIRDTLEELDRERGTAGNRIFYFSVPPSAFAPLAERLGAEGLSAQEGGNFARMVVEKPFGHNLESARELNGKLHVAFTEEQIYRIDHYLGKETVQNLLVFRFANGIFEPLWSRQYIDHVQITVAENIGVEGRGGYYEESGALRDIIQNHVMQLMAIVGMEAPSNFRAETVRDEKVKLLRAVRPIHPDDAPLHTVRGQYGPGWIDGEREVGYREEEGVRKDSVRESFVAVKVEIDNWRWAGTPFYLRTGKRLPKRATEIAIQFRRVPHSPFGGNVAMPSGLLPSDSIDPNLLVLRIQPDEGITLRFSAKVPGQSMRIRTVNMDFLYDSAFLKESPEAYERLLLDCMLGDTTLFAREDEVEEAWRFCTAILDGWRAHPPKVDEFPNYEAGTWGPQSARDFMARDGRQWRRL